MDNLCIRSFLQETQSLSLLILIWCVASVPTVSPYPFFSISFLSCNIYLYYELNDFYFVWFVFLLFSFDVIIIAPSNVFVNTFLYFSHNYYLFHYLQYIYIVYFSYYILFSDNSFCSVFSFSSPYRSPFFPHTNKQTGHHSYRNRKYSWVLRYAIHA